jgi:hypothetical protein
MLVPLQQPLRLLNSSTCAAPDNTAGCVLRAVATAGLLGWALRTLRGSSAGAAGSAGGHTDRGPTSSVAEGELSSWQAVKETSPQRRGFLSTAGHTSWRDQASELVRMQQWQQQTCQIIQDLCTHLSTCNQSAALPLLATGLLALTNELQATETRYERCCCSAKLFSHVALCTIGKCLESGVQKIYLLLCYIAKAHSLITHASCMHNECTLVEHSLASNTLTLSLRSCALDSSSARLQPHDATQFST